MHRHYVQNMSGEAAVNGIGSRAQAVSSI
jgi:hypothetical protein